MITVPAVENSARRPSDGVAVMRTDTVWPTRVGHLGGDSALPDQVVQPELVAASSRPTLVRRAEAVAGRTDRLVRLLRVLHLPLVPARLLRHVLGAVAARGPGRAPPSSADSDNVVESVRMYVM